MGDAWSRVAQWLRQASQGMKCAVHDLEFMGSNPSWVKFVCVVLLPESYLNQKVSSYDQGDILWERLEFNGQPLDVTHMKCLYLTFNSN